MNVIYWSFAYIIFVLLSPVGKSANVLCLFPIPSKSHDILGSTLSKHLASIGHNVTYISAFTHTKTENFYGIHVKAMDEIKAHMKKYTQGNASTVDVIMQAFNLAHIAELIFEDDSIQNLISSNSKFDVVIHLIGLDASIALAHHFDAPLIIFVPIGAVFSHNKMMGNPAPPSYIPTLVTPYNEDMTFMQRLLNGVIPFVFFNFVEGVCNYVGNRVIKTHLPDFPTMQEIIEQRADLMLVNSHISTESPRPYVPNMIQIGGFHLHKPEALSEDLKKVLDDAKYGFVYFSFGTNVNVKQLPQNLLEIFKKSLGRLPFKIIMKYEDETMPNQPSNFYLRKWFPQPSVLAHPNAKLFVSHGGYGGITESLYNGVPIVCIPFFGDQSKNCRDAEHNGFAVTVKIQTLSEAEFSQALKKVLYEETFKKVVQFKSEIYRNQPMNPMDKAVYWIEHVIKYKGAKHLKVKGMQLPWYQYHLIDVFVFLGFVILLVISCSYYSCRFLYRKLVCKKHKLKSL